MNKLFLLIVDFSVLLDSIILGENNSLCYQYILKEIDSEEFFTKQQVKDMREKHIKIRINSLKSRAILIKNIKLGLRITKCDSLLKETCANIFDILIDYIVIFIFNILTTSYICSFFILSFYMFLVFIDIFI